VIAAQTSDEKDALIAELFKEIERLRGIVEEQGRIIKEQAKIIEEWKRGHRKRGRRTKRAKRGPKASPKKPGRKAGHDGDFRPPPDQAAKTTELHRRTDCSTCGSQARPTGETRRRYREEFEPAKRYLVEEVDHETECVCCGQRQWSRPQPPPSGSTVLGPTVVALAAYMHFDLKLSWHETARFLTEMVGVQVTAGGLTQLFARLATRLRPVVEDIKREALALPFLHVDETSWYETGSLRWLWIVSHPSLSLFHIDKSRGRKVARALLTDDEVDELFQGIAITDFLSVYRYFEGLDHQYCWPHLVREARRIAEIDGGPLTERFLNSLVSIYHDGKRAQALEDDGERHGIRVRLGKLIADRELATHDGIARLQRRMDEEFPFLLTFLDMPGLPADNNQAERDLRPAVMMRHTSFQTRSQTGSRTLADMMTVVQTAKKRDIPLPAVIEQALNGPYDGRAPPSLHAGP
jgi:transposase